MTQGILVVGDPDPAVRSKAEKFQLALEISQGYSIPFDKTLILTAGTRVPWDLLPAAWAFLDRWDAALPLWRYGVTAADLGNAAERKITQAIIRDLRVLVYSHELLFVRKNEPGLQLIERWISELERGPDPRLAFLRAYYLVKPRLCTLPISWLASVRAASAAALRTRHPRLQNLKKSSLVRVEISPGRFVKVHRDDVERVQQFHSERAGN